MVACQVSHTIFNTPVKIARIRSQAYLNPLYGDLYAPDDMPIDHIISPEKEVSAAVSNQLRVPGAFDVKDMCEGKMNLVGVLLTDDSPIRDVAAPSDQSVPRSVDHRAGDHPRWQGGDPAFWR